MSGGAGFTPVNQVRLTNVATVRLKKGGKRFEVACYRNKARDWRQGLEKDINEVLHVQNIFSNVSRGTLSSEKDIIKSFGTNDINLVLKEILEKGHIQISEQEREAYTNASFKDIARIVSEKTINPENSRPYSVINFYFTIIYG